MSNLQINIDLETAQNVTTSYLQELYKEYQKDNVDFLKERVAGKKATTVQWKDQEILLNTIFSIASVLEALMVRKDYDVFITNVNEKLFEKLVERHETQK